MIFSEPQKYSIRTFLNICFLAPNGYTTNFGRLPCDVSITSSVPCVRVSVCALACARRSRADGPGRRETHWASGPVFIIADGCV